MCLQAAQIGWKHRKHVRGPVLALVPVLGSQHGEETSDQYWLSERRSRFFLDTCCKTGLLPTPFLVGYERMPLLYRSR